MKKSINILMIVILAFFTMPFNGMTALANEKTYDDIEDGEYNITAKALHADKDEASGAAGFINEDATLSVKDGAIELIITIPNNDMAQISGLQVEGNEPTVKETDDSKQYIYQLNALTTYLDGQVQYEVPALNMEHDVPFRFELEGLDDLPVIEDETEDDIEEPGDSDDGEEGNEDNSDGDNEDGSEDSGDSGDSDGDSEDDSEDSDSDDSGDTDGDNEDDSDESEDTGDTEEGNEDDSGDAGNTDEDNSENSGDSGDNGEESKDKPSKTKEINYTIMHENGKDASAADSFFKKPGVIFEKGGKQYAEVVITSASMVKSLESFGKEATIVERNVDGKDTVKVQFQINNDLSATNLNMHIAVPGLYDMEHEALFVIDEEKSDDGNEGSDNSGQETDGKNPKKHQVVDSDTNTEKPDKLYTIDYDIMNENGVDISVADTFFKKPGTLLEKDGEMYLQVTIENGDMIEALSSKYGDAVIIDKNADGSIALQFRVNSDLSDTLLEMSINVPGLYSEDHKAILVFDKDSMVEGDIGNHRIYDSNSNNSLNDDSSDDSVNDNATPKKPAFGSNDEDGASGVDKTDNPQTGDTTGILLYSLLLIGSLVPLAIKFRRRFI